MTSILTCLLLANPKAGYTELAPALKRADTIGRKIVIYVFDGN